MVKEVARSTLSRLSKAIEKVVEQGIGKVLRDCVIHITVVIKPNTKEK